MRRFCPNFTRDSKFYTCGEALAATVLGEIRNNAAVMKTVRLCCPKCGWTQDEYEIEDVPGKQSAERDRELRNAQQRRHYQRLRTGKVARS